MEANISYRVVTYDIPENLQLEISIFGINGNEVESAIGTATTPINFFYEPPETGSYTIRVRGRNGRFNSEQAYTLQVGCNQTTAAPVVAQLGNNAIYPNPFSEQFNLDLSAYNFTTARLTLRRVDGTAVLNHEVTSPRTSVNVAHLTPGLYFVEVTSANRKLIGRILRK